MALVVIVSILFGVFLTECAYRVFLYKAEFYKFIPVFESEAHPSFYYFQDSPFRYSEEFGYEYVPGVVNGGYIYEGRILDCYDAVWGTNERGNPGPIRGSYKDADVKVLAFGDSFTQQGAWPTYLQEMLTAELGRSAHVVNFGRDAYGILQMFDLAAAKVREWQPDLVVFAFITDDLTRDRFWRTKTVLDGHERIMVSLQPDPHPDWTNGADLYVMNSKATREWCNSLEESQATGDPVVSELEETVRKGREVSRKLASVFSLSQSFVFDQIWHGDAFHTSVTQILPARNPRHRLDHFGEDERTVRNIQALKAKGVPFMIVHLATYRDLKAGREYRGRRFRSSRRKRLLDSLQKLTGKPVYGTLDHAEAPKGKLKSMVKDYPKNLHPNGRGARFYSRMILTALKRNGYLDGLP
jgi:hypothetical protein